MLFCVCCIAFSVTAAGWNLNGTEMCYPSERRWRAKLFLFLLLFTPFRTEASVPCRTRVPNQEKWLNDKIFLIVSLQRNSLPDKRVSIPVSMAAGRSKRHNCQVLLYIV
jgi:hypothetical protein